MNFFSMFEDRIAGVFGTSPQGYTEPFSFKKLAKRAVREMENETFVIDGVDTAPALYTILVSAEDDAVMRALYASLTIEISQLVEAQAQRKGYTFVGQPLVRFMVDPTLRNGRFSVFAENVDVRTLNRLRAEEASFLGEVVSTPSPAAPAPKPTPRNGNVARTERRASATPMAAVVPTPAVEPVAQASEPGVATPVPAPLGGTDAGLDVLPANDVEPPINLADPQLAEQPYAAQPQARGARNVPLVNPRRDAGAAPGIAGGAPVAEPSAPASSCMLIDRQSGRTYTLTGPAVTIGRERTAGGVVLHDPNISRRHAELTYDGRDWRIRDLNSTNGTLVNDVDVDECILRTGDLVTLGLTNLEFREN